MTGLAAARAGVLVTLVVGAHLAGHGAAAAPAVVAGLAGATLAVEADVLHRRPPTGRRAAAGLATRLVVLQLAGHAAVALTCTTGPGMAMDPATSPSATLLPGGRMAVAHLLAAALAALWLTAGERAALRLGRLLAAALPRAPRVAASCPAARPRPLPAPGPAPLVGLLLATALRQRGPPAAAGPLGA